MIFMILKRSKLPISGVLPLFVDVFELELDLPFVDESPPFPKSVSTSSYKDMASIMLFRM